MAAPWKSIGKGIREGMKDGMEKHGKAIGEGMKDGMLKHGKAIWKGIRESGQELRQSLAPSLKWDLSSLTIGTSIYLSLRLRKRVYCGGLNLLFVLLSSLYFIG